MQVVASITFAIWVTSCARIFLFVGFADGSLLLLCCLLFVLPSCSFSWCFFCSVQCLIFLQWKAAGYINLHMLVFVFFVLIVWFFASCFLMHVHIAPKIRCFAIIPPLNPLWPPRLSLPTTWCFVARAHAWKTCPDRRFLPCFSLFSCAPVQLRPSTPLQTPVHPSGAVCAHFAFVLQNMMFGEISPAIGPKLGPART